MKPLLVEFVVAQGKKEQARGYAHLDGARIVGTDSGPAPSPADIVFTVTPADATALHDGTLDLSVGFMRGQVKMAGDFGALLQFLPLTAGAEPAVSVAELLPE
jgi:hypothetical protein